MTTGKIASLQVTFDGQTWLNPPVDIAVPTRIGVMTTFNIETTNTARVKNILTLTYGDQVTPFESLEGAVNTGLYYFNFPLEFPAGMPLGDVQAVSEVFYWDGEWKTLDSWEGKLGDVTYQLIGKLTALGRKVDEQLTPLPFSVVADEPFTLGVSGFLQTPKAGQLTVEVELYTPDGKVVTREITKDITEPQAVNWAGTQEFTGFDIPGGYTGRITYRFDNQLLDSLEGRLFDVAAGAPTARFDITSAVGAMAAVGLIAALVPKLIRG